jgi:hypothetical protein
MRFEALEGQQSLGPPRNEQCGTINGAVWREANKKKAE